MCAGLFHQNMSFNAKGRTIETSIKINVFFCTRSARRHLHKYPCVLACLSHMSVRMMINAKKKKNMITQPKGKKINLLPDTLLISPCPLFPKPNCLPLFCLIPYRQTLPLLFTTPTHNCSQSTFSSSPISSAIIPLFHFS